MTYRLKDHPDITIWLAEEVAHRIGENQNPDKFTRVQGMNVTFVTSTNSDDEAREMLRGLGMPFQAEEGSAAGAA